LLVFPHYSAKNTTPLIEVTMTLSRQLLITLLCLILLLVGSLFWLYLSNIQTLLIKQVEFQTQSAVNSLNLTLKPLLAKNNLQTSETIIDGFFSHGYYQDLKLTDIRANSVLIQRSAPLLENTPPSWFTDLIQLPSPTKKSEVSVYQAGHAKKYLIQLTASQASSYQQLWLGSKHMLILSTIIFIISIMTLFLLIRWQLQPLKDIEEHAIAISQRDFQHNLKIPKTTELKSVVLTMNSMSEKLQYFVDELTEEAESLLHKTQQDEITGLMNRLSFLEKFKEHMNEQGVLLIIRIQNLNDLNKSYGYATGNKILSTIAELLKNEGKQFPIAITGRISGGDLAISIPNISLDHFQELHTNMIHAHNLNEKAKIISGITEYKTGHSVSSALSRADHALAIAIFQDKTIAHIDAADNASHSLPAMDWANFINLSLKNNSIKLASQALLSVQGDTICHCILARPQSPQGDELPAKSFFAMTELLGQGEHFDRIMALKLFDYMSTHTDNTSWGLKILTSTWYSKDFHEWLYDKLEQQPNLANRLFIICNESSLSKRVELSSKYIKKLQKRGVRFIIDSFNSGENAFHNLKELRPDFVRLDASVIRELPSNDEHALFIKITCSIAHALFIGVIAGYVESDEINDALAQFDIDAIQGYQVSPVKALS